MAIRVLMMGMVNIKKSNMNRKSTIAVAIGIIMVAAVLLGSLGFVLWQNNRTQSVPTSDIAPTYSNQNCTAILKEFYEKAKSDPLHELTKPVADCLQDQ